MCKCLRVIKGLNKYAGSYSVKDKMCSLNRQVVQAREERKQEDRGESEESGEMRNVLNVIRELLEPFTNQKAPVSEHE